jgi:hypothetical protein
MVDDREFEASREIGGSLATPGVVFAIGSAVIVRKHEPTRLR